MTFIPAERLVVQRIPNEDTVLVGFYEDGTPQVRRARSRKLLPKGTMH